MRLTRSGPLMSRGVLIRQLGDGLGEGKFEDDFAVVVHHLDHRAEQRLARTFAAQQLQDHGPRDLKGAIGIAQFLSVGIDDQLVADPGIEEISGHDESNGAGTAEMEGGESSQVLYSMFPVRYSAWPRVPAPERGDEPLDRLGIWQSRAEVDTALHKTLRRPIAKDFTGELFVRG